VDGSFAYYTLKKDEEDMDFEMVWQSLNILNGIKLQFEGVEL
jgi:hypothetical protein